MLDSQDRFPPVNALPNDAYGQHLKRRISSNNRQDGSSRGGPGDSSGILSFGNVKVGKRKFEMSGPAAGLVQQRMQERLRQRNEL